MPADILHQVAPKDRAERWTKQKGNSQRCRTSAPLLGWKGIEDHRHRQWSQRPSTQSLQDPKDDQTPQAPGEAAERGADGECDKSRQIDPLSAKPVSQVASKRDTDAHGK